MLYYMIPTSILWRIQRQFSRFLSTINLLSWILLWVFKKEDKEERLI